MMKKQNKKHTKSEFWFYKLTGLSFLLSGFVLFSLAARASGSDPEQAGGSVWYTQPWVWLTGAAIVIIGVVAIMKSGKSGHDK